MSRDVLPHRIRPCDGEPVQPGGGGSPPGRHPGVPPGREDADRHTGRRHGRRGDEAREDRDRMSMTNVDPSVVRKLAQWNPDGIPITSVYLTVDGRRYPRKSDYEVRLDDLLRRGRAQAEGEELSKEALRSVLGDLESIDSFVRDEFERGDTRGLALFSANAAGLWEEVRLSRPVRDR